MEKYNISELFSFDKREVVTMLLYTMKLRYKFKDAFAYVSKHLSIQNLKPLNELKWQIGKSYNWAALKHNNVTLIIRHYQQHFTIFFKIDDEYDFMAKHGCLTYHSNLDKLSDELSDELVYNKFTDIDVSLPKLIELISDNSVCSIWNDLIFERPKHVDVKSVWDGGESHIDDIEDFVFACDELFEQYLQYFAQTDMYEKIKTLKVGDKVGAYKVMAVSTKVENDYFHNAGLELTNTNFPKKGGDFKDVYTLTRWYLKDIFPELNLVKD